MSDSIAVRGLRVPTRIGVTDRERNQEQVVVVDLDVEVDVAAAAASDDLSKTLDYASLVKGVAEVVADVERDLLERLANDIASFVLREGRVEAVTVRVGKAVPPVEEDVETISVVIRRTADG